MLQGDGKCITGEKKMLLLLECLDLHKVKITAFMFFFCLHVYVW